MITEYNWEYAVKNGFTPVASQDVTGFQPKTDTGTVYCTIVTDSGIVVCDSYPKREDYSVIVNAKGYVKETLHGKLWIDTQGKNHRL